MQTTAGRGAWNEEFVLGTGRWRLPEGMIRDEGDAEPHGLRILRVRGPSMVPELREGDRAPACPGDAPHRETRAPASARCPATVWTDAHERRRSSGAKSVLAVEGRCP